MSQAGVRRDQDSVPGRTERWVKWAISIALIILVPLVAMEVTTKTDLAVLKTQVEMTSRDRVEQDQHTLQVLEKLADQHQQFMNLVQRQMDLDVTFRQSLPARRTVPAFGPP